MDAHSQKLRIGDESGVTLLELIVVLILIAIVMSIAALSISGRKSSTGIAIGVATAQAYASALDTFTQEHAGRVPIGIGSADWPVANTGPASFYARGTKAGVPLKSLYLADVPESVTGKQITIGTSGGTDGWIQYSTANGGATYLLDVYDWHNTYRCTISNGALPGGKQSCNMQN